MWLALSGQSLALFNDAISGHDTIGSLLERLSARLGEEQVYRLALHDDHRPECATRPATLFDKPAVVNQALLPRPLWLVDPPESLAEVDGRPYRQGHLKCGRSGAHRIGVVG